MTRRTMHVRRATGCAKSAPPHPIRSLSTASRFERSSHRLNDVVGLAPRRHRETTPDVIAPAGVPLAVHAISVGAALRGQSRTLAQPTAPTPAAIIAAWPS